MEATKPEYKGKEVKLKEERDKAKVRREKLRQY